MRTFVVLLLQRAFVLCFVRLLTPAVWFESEESLEVILIQGGVYFEHRRGIS